jgi:hypothetical protein
MVRRRTPMELTDILDPDELDRITELFQKAIDAIKEIVDTLFKPFVNYLTNLIKDIFELAPLCTSSRVRYLCDHAKRYRHRKKNKNRMMKDFIKCMRRA